MASASLAGGPQHCPWRSGNGTRRRPAAASGVAHRSSSIKTNISPGDTYVATASVTSWSVRASASSAGARRSSSTPPARTARTTTW
jgi:hypothetical protein